MKKIRVGMVGLGTVGSGVLHVLRTNAEELARRTGTVFELTRFASRSPERWEGLGLDPAKGATNPMDVALAEDVDLFVEVMGGVEGPRELVKAALKSGKCVVTANKALLAEHGDEIFAVATHVGRRIGFEASVCGGVPVIELLKTGFASENIRRLVGIVNGTCNFMLTEMADKGTDYADALAEAQRLGFAEADPTLDVNGMDSAHKLALLSLVAWGVRLKTDEVAVSGIEAVSSIDINFARELGMTVKLVASAVRGDDDRLSLSVDPTLVPSSSLMGQVHGPVNAVMIDGRHVGPLVISGAGAGRLPTANAVVADMLEAARFLDRPSCDDAAPTGYPEKLRRDAVLLPAEDARAEYYLRFTALDRPGVLAMIAQDLAQRGISIAQVIQHGRDKKEAVPVMILTHEARRGDLESAVAEIDRSDKIMKPTVVMKVLREVA